MLVLRPAVILNVIQCWLWGLAEQWFWGLSWCWFWGLACQQCCKSCSVMICETHILYYRASLISPVLFAARCSCLFVTQSQCTYSYSWYKLDESWICFITINYMLSISFMHFLFLCLWICLVYFLSFPSYIGFHYFLLLFFWLFLYVILPAFLSAFSNLSFPAGVWKNNCFESLNPLSNQCCCFVLYTRSARESGQCRRCVGCTTSCSELYCKCWVKATHSCDCLAKGLHVFLTAVSVLCLCVASWACRDMYTFLPALQLILQGLSVFWGSWCVFSFYFAL